MIVVDRPLGMLAGVSGILIAGAVALGWVSLEEHLWVVVVPLIFSLLALLFNIVYLNRVLFIVTDRRIITRYGLFTLRYADLGVDKVQNVTIIQPWYERILGFGDIYFATAGERGGIDYRTPPGIKLMTGGAITWEDISQSFRGGQDGQRGHEPECYAGQDSRANVLRNDEHTREAQTIGRPKRKRE